MTRTEQAWKGRGLLHWQMTMWCNYACKYCRQDHSRHSTLERWPWMDNDVGNRPPAKAHWADNAPPELWLRALESCFKDRRMHILMTGGEPLLDRLNMERLLAGFASAPWVETFRIETNASARPHTWPIDWSKAEFMVSYHPDEVDRSKFFQYLDGMLDAGLCVPVVNLVVLPSRVPDLRRIAADLRARDVALAALPAYGSAMYYSPEQLVELKRFVPPVDWVFRSGGSTAGRSCLYPAIAYEMNPDGSASVACHPQYGNVFDGSLPKSFDSCVPCPHPKCSCMVRYSFLRELDYNADSTPLAGYAKRYKELPLC